MCIMLAITNSSVAAPAVGKTTNPSSVLLSKLSPSSSSLTSSLLPSMAVSSTTIDTQQSNSSTLDSRRRKRHSKRQSSKFDSFDLNVNSTILEWVNPCGGFFDPTAVTDSKPNRTKIFEKLGEDILTEFQYLKYGHQYINTEDFDTWSYYETKYKFLPKLKIKPTIPLKRWYRNLQTYVASFAYLRRMQLKSLKSKNDSENAAELKTLLLSSRNMLCELELAINKTHPNHQTNNQLPQVSRNEMNERLKFITRPIVTPSNREGEVIEVNSTDLKFAKVYYKRFLRIMRRNIRKFLERRAAKQRKAKLQPNAGKGVAKTQNSKRRRKQMDHKRA